MVFLCPFFFLQGIIINIFLCFVYFEAVILHLFKFVFFGRGKMAASFLAVVQEKTSLILRAG